MYDVAIIGAGVIGTVIARELSKYKIKTVILEKNRDIALGATNVNSGIVHTGYDNPINSRMSKFCKEGSSLFPILCDELSVPYRRTGSLACAFTSDEVKELKRQLRNGKKLGIRGLKLLKGKKLRKCEPALNPQVAAALHSPEAGVTLPWDLAVACVENSVENGVDLKLNYEVQSVKKTDTLFYISSENKYIRSKSIINCAGVLADDVAAMMIAMPDFRIIPEKGTFSIRNRKECGDIGSVILSANSSHGKGTYIVPSYRDKILVGYGKMTKVVDPESENFDSALYPDSDKGDFIIGESEVEGFFNVAGISFSGLSAAPSIANYIREKVLKHLDAHEENRSFNPFRKLRHQRGRGKIICSCDNISEEEIVDVIGRRAGAITVSGILRRLRPETGGCREEVCHNAITAILTREILTEPRQSGFVKDDFFNIY